MARTRLLKPEFFRSEDVCALPPMTRLMFAGLWTLADKDGRLLDRPRRIGVDLFPFDDVDAADMLTQIAAVGLIVRYAADGKNIIQVTGFAKHQAPHFREPSLGLPEPTSDDVRQSLDSSGLAQEFPEQASANSPLPDPVSDPVPKASCSEPPSAPSEPPILDFPTAGKPDRWGLTSGLVRTWQGLFPGVAIELECRAALAWVLANPAKKKTANGMPRFLVSWLGRSQNRGAGGFGQPRGSPPRDPLAGLEDLTPRSTKANTA